MNERPRWSAADRAWSLATQNFQLLAMLEVLQHRTEADVADLALAARMTMAFPAQVSPAERAYPVDPTGRARAALAQAQAKALQLPMTVREVADLADACRDLCDWIAVHDQPFEDPAPDALQSVAMS